MAGVRLGAFTIQAPEQVVPFTSLSPLDLFETAGEPYIKVDTTKLDNAVSLRDGRPAQFTGFNQVILIDMVVTKTGVTYERRKTVKPAKTLDSQEFIEAMQAEAKPAKKPKK